MQNRKLGSQGLRVSAIGLGCMGMSDFYGDSEQQANLEVLSRALDHGVTFWDTADIYGPFTNERLLGTFFSQHPGSRDNVMLASKFGIVRNQKGEFTGINGRPEYVKSACDSSLKNLGTDYLDLYYQHRVDPDVPIEETAGAMADLVKSGKVKYIGLSEASASTIRRAHTEHPVSAVQSEYSLWSREVEEAILPVCRELEIGFVPYSPLGRGFLTGAIKKRSDLQDDDWRLHSPRFSEENFELNLKLADCINRLAQQKGCTNAQLALSWLLHQGDFIAPIPGTRHLARLAENSQAVEIYLSNEELKRIDTEMNKNPVRGTRYPEENRSLLFGDTPPLKHTADDSYVAT